MTDLPFRCERCGCLFTSGFIKIANSKNVGFGDVRMPCPQCGREARSLRGTFDFVDDTIKAISADARSIQILALLRQAAESIASGKNPEKIIDDISQVSPEVARQAKSALNAGGISLLIMLLLAIIHGCSAGEVSTLNWNELLDQAHVYMTGEQAYPLVEQSSEQAQTAEPRTEPSKPLLNQTIRQAKKRKLENDRRGRREQKARASKPHPY